MLLAYSFTKEVSLVICFKVIIRHIIVDKAGISSIVFLDSVVHPHLKAFLVFVKEIQASVNVIKGVITFFEEPFTVVKRSFF